MKPVVGGGPMDLLEIGAVGSMPIIGTVESFLIEPEADEDKDGGDLSIDKVCWGS